MAGVIVMTTLALGGVGYWFVDRPRLEAKTEKERRDFLDAPFLEQIMSPVLRYTMYGAAGGFLLSFVAVQGAK